MPLSRQIEALRAMQPDMRAMSDSLSHYDEYPRVCYPQERVADLLAEAKAHNCVLAFRGQVTCIMPKLIDGWSLHPTHFGEDELERLRKLV